MYDIVALGELLIDFTPQGKSQQGNFLFEANPGGAPCNMLAAAAKLGRKTAFIGKVGNDDFGKRLKDSIEHQGINADSLYLTDESFTTLAFVTLGEDGSRSFSFARKPGADTLLRAEEVDEELIKSAKVFHCGTLSMTHEPAKSATMKALETAKTCGTIISADPNIRLKLWASEESAREAMRTVLGYADIVKISDDELEFFYGSSDIEKSGRRLMDEFDISLLFITCARAGAYAMNKAETVYHPAYTCLKAVDSTGAGDAFCGVALSELLNAEDPKMPAKDELTRILSVASAAAGIVCTRYGAAAVMPSREEIENLIADGNL